MLMKDKLSLCIISSLVLLVGCGGPPKDKGRGIRTGYTTKQVIQAFNKRSEIQVVKENRPPIVVEETRKGYLVASQAVDQAPSGSTVTIPEGVFLGPLPIYGKKSLIIRGAGAGRSIIVGPNSALKLRGGAQVEISGVSFWSRSVREDVPVVLVEDSQLNMSDCTINGGVGPGIHIAGEESDVALMGNLIKGNMGGGIRVKGGKLSSQRNVITRNAVAGLVLAPSAPGSIRDFSLWHDTVLDNWAGFRCVSFVRSGVVPLGELSNFRVYATILNSGGLGETFSEEYYGAVKKKGWNYPSPEPLPSTTFFMGAEKDDYRPSVLLQKDPLGIEVGAFASEAGAKELEKNLNNALVSDKLQVAYLLSLFFEPAKRERSHVKIREVLYGWVEDYLKTKRLGIRLFAVLGLARVAPAGWRMEVILDRFLAGYAQKYTYTIRPLNFFDDAPELGQKILTHLRGNTSLFPRYLSESGSSPNAYVLSGLIKTPPVTQTKKNRFEIAKKLDNPRRGSVESTIKMYVSRLKGMDKKLQDLNYKLTNPHFHPRVNKSSKYRKTLQARLAKMKAEKAEFEAKITALRADYEDSSDVFEITVKGSTLDTQVTGEYSAQLVAAPSGDILLDEITEIKFLHTEITVEPLEEYGLPGKTLTGQFASPEDLAARRIADWMLASVIEKETKQLRFQLDKFTGGIINDKEEDKLVELLLLNAGLYARSLELKDEYDKLVKARDSQTTGIEVAVAHDTEKGLGRKGVQINVTHTDRAALAQRLQLLERIYKPYWELQDSIEHFLKTRFGLTRKLFFETKAVLEGMIKK